MAVLLAEGIAESGRALVAAGTGDQGDAEAGLRQELAGPGHPLSQEQPGRGGETGVGEAPSQLARGQVEPGRELAHAQTLAGPGRDPGQGAGDQRIGLARTLTRAAHHDPPRRQQAHARARGSPPTGDGGVHRLATEVFGRQVDAADGRPVVAREQGIVIAGDHPQSPGHGEIGLPGHGQGRMGDQDGEADQAAAMRQATDPRLDPGQVLVWAERALCDRSRQVGEGQPMATSNPRDPRGAAS